MAGSKRNKIDRLSAEKNEFIIKRLTAFESLIDAAGQALFDKLVEQFFDVLDSEDGELLNTPQNVEKVNTIERIWQDFQKREGYRIITTFVGDLTKIMDLGRQYYVELIPNKTPPREIVTIINKQLGIEWKGKEWTPTKNGYIETLVKDRTAITDVKKIAYKNIIAKTGPAALKTELKNYLVSTKEDASQFKRFYETVAFDTYSEIDRLNSKLHADRLGLKYFLFNGGLVKDSRQFCIDHHGKCYTKEEAEGWRDLIGKFEMKPGKVKKLVKVPIGPIVEDEKTYDPVRDLGGIRCRHSADYVSEEIAIVLRKENPPTIP